MKALRWVVDRLVWFSAGIAALALLFEVIVILVDVVGRALGRPLYGSLDMVTMAMVILVFGAMALCDRRGGHVAVDLLQSFFSERLNRYIDALSALLGAIIFVTLAWAVFASSKISLMLNLSTNLLELPKAWFQYALIFFAVVAALSMALRSIELAFFKIEVRQTDSEGSAT